MGLASNEVAEALADEKQSGSRFCLATTKAGRTCGLPVLRAGGEFCWVHAPTVSEKRREAQRRGGSTTTRRRALLLGRVTFTDSQAVLAFREALTAAVIGGSLPPARATCALMAAKDAEQALFGAGLEARLDAIEGQLRELAAEETGSDDGH